MTVALEDLLKIAADESGAHNERLTAEQLRTLRALGYIQ